MEWLTCANPSARPSCEQALNHPFFAGHRPQPSDDDYIDDSRVGVDVVQQLEASERIEENEKNAKYVPKLEMLFDPVDEDTRMCVRTFNRGDKRILVVDGGGTRGIIPLRILQEMENELNSVCDNPVPIHQHFDLIVGTSIGGILAMCIGYCGWSLRKVEEKYFEMVNEVFRKKRSFHVIKGRPQLYTYKAENTVKNMFPPRLEDWNPDDLPRRDDRMPHVMVVCSQFDNSVGRYNGVLFTTYPSGGDDEYERFPLCVKNLWIAARATSAAPTFFRSMKVSCGDQTFRLEDGGIDLNCPIVPAVYDARNILQWQLNENGNADEKISLVVSIGTGRSDRMVGANDGGDGVYGTVGRVFRHMRSNVANSSANYQNFLKFVAQENRHVFQRLNPKLDSKYVKSMIESNERKLRLMAQLAFEDIEHKTMWEDVLRFLSHEKWRRSRLSPSQTVASASTIQIVSEQELVKVKHSSQQNFRSSGAVRNDGGFIAEAIPEVNFEMVEPELSVIRPKHLV